MPVAPSTPTTAPASSRSRIEGSREDEVLDATLEVLEQVGCDKLTMDAVAGAARAGKASLYRRWGSKNELVADAIDRAHRRCGAINEFDTGSLRGDLLSALCDTSFVDHRLTRVMAGVLTAMQHDDELRQALLERFVKPRKQATLDMLERAQRRGEVHAEADLNLLADILPSMLAMRAIISGEGVTSASMVRVIDQVLLPAAAAPPRPLTPDDHPVRPVPGPRSRPS